MPQEIKEMQAPLTLNFVRNFIKGTDTEKLARIIKGAQDSLKLYVGIDSLGDGDAMLLVEAIKEVQIPLHLRVDLKLEDIRVELLAYILAKIIKEARVPLSLELISNNLRHLEILSVIKEARVPFTLELCDMRTEGDNARILAEIIKYAQAPLTLHLFGCMMGPNGVLFLADAIKEAQVPLSLDLGRNNIGDDGAMFLADAIKKVRVPLTLDLYSNNIRLSGLGLLAYASLYAQAPLTLGLCANIAKNAGAWMFAQSLKDARVPFSVDLSDKGCFIMEKGNKLLANAQKDNFIVDARLNPSQFLDRAGLSKKILMQELGCPSVLVVLIQEYIGEDDMAWVEVAAIRALDGASHDNKYSSINYTLLNAVYNIPLTPQQALERMVDEGKEAEDAHNREAVSNVTAAEDRASSSSSYSSSSSSSSSSPSDGGASLSSELSSQPPTLLDHILSNAQPISHELQSILQVCYNKGEPSAAEDLLVTLFAWVKDLSDELKHQILSSFSMQRVSKLFEVTTQFDKFITSQPIEEIFAAEHQKYYGQFLNDSQSYAQENQAYSSLLNDDGIRITSDGMLIDQLPKHGVDFGTLHPFTFLA